MLCKQNRNRKSIIEMKKNGPLIGAWFKHVPLRFLGFEKIHDLPPIAKIKKLRDENRKADRKHEQQQFSVSYWPAQPRQDITSGLPYTTHNPQLARQTQPYRSSVNSQQANHNNSPDVLRPCFPACEPQRRELEIISA